MTSLDDLLRYDEDPRPSGRRQRSRRVRVAIAVLTCFVAAYVIQGALAIVGIGVPYVFPVSLLLSLVVLRGVLARVVAPPLPSTLRDARSASPVWPEGSGDGIRDAVNRWDVRLDWGRRDTRFGPIVAQALIELIDERLRLHHGINRGDDPVRARELLGPALWALVHEPVSHSLSPQEMATLVARMEAL